MSRSGGRSAEVIHGGVHCGVVGFPIAHSRSPVLHRAAYRELGLQWRYDAHEVRAGELAGFLAGRSAAWRGLSVTMPLKREALDLAAERSPMAAVVGGANTLIRRADGSWAADNTDVSGLGTALRTAAIGIPQRVEIWGAGATAASAIAAIHQLAPDAQVRLRARSRARAEPTLAVAKALGSATQWRSWAEPAPEQADLVISTAPATAMADVAAQAAASAAPGAGLFDVIYDPWPTPLAVAWDAVGGPVISGLELLLHQAVDQVRLMTGRAVDADVLRAALHRDAR